MDTPQINVREVPVTDADRKAMLHKHPIETPLVEVSRTHISPTMTLIAKRQMIEVYRHEIDGVVKIYNVRELKDLIGQNMIPVKALRLELNGPYVDHIFNYGGCEQAHIDRITQEDIKRPAIGLLYPDGVQIVDGSHRIVARWRRFGKKEARLLLVPGEIDDLFLFDPREQEK